MKYRANTELSICVNATNDDLKTPSSPFVNDKLANLLRAGRTLQNHVQVLNKLINQLPLPQREKEHRNP